MATKTPNTTLTLAEFLDGQVFPALYHNLDAAFPEFGWRSKGGLWQATKEQATRNLTDSPRPARVQAYRNAPFGFKIHGGGFVTWLAYLNGGAKPHGHDFIKTVKLLADKAGVPFPEREFTPAEQTHWQARERRSNLLESFLALTKAALLAPAGATARQYLQTRGFAGNYLAQTDFGYFPAPAEIQAGLLRYGFTSDEIHDSGLLKDPRWAGRVVHPWRDLAGHITTYWARTIQADSEASSKYLFLAGGVKSVPFGADAVRDKDVVLVEGLLDVLLLRSRGLDNVLGLGGATLTDAQKQSLTRMRLRSVTLCLDYDPQAAPCATHQAACCLPCSAGWKGTLATLQCLRDSQVRLYVVEPQHLADPSAPAQKADPDSFVRQHGAAAFRHLLQQAGKAALFQARDILRRHDLTTSQGKDAATEQLLEYDESLTDPRDSADLWQLAASHTGYTADTLRQLAAGYHEKRLLEAATQELGRVLHDAQQALQVRHTPTKTLLHSLTAQLETLASRFQTDEPEPFAVATLIDKIRHAGAGKTSGWDALDRLEVQFHPAELSVLGARTGHGKTTALLSLLQHWLATYTQEHFVFYSYELPPEAFLLKLASALTYQVGESWSYYDIKSWWQRKDDRDYPNPDTLRQAERILQDWQNRLAVVYRPAWTVDELVAHAHRHASRQGPPGGIVVDYLQLVPPPAGAFDRRDIAVSSVARKLKKLAVDLSCPVACAAQIGRQAAQGGEKIPLGPLTAPDVQEAIKKRRPQLHHLREGGSEQEADLVLGLLNYRADFLEEKTNATYDAPSRFEVLILKNRYGSGGFATLAFEGRTGTIRDVRPDDML